MSVKKIFLLFFLCYIGFSSYGQNLFFIGNKSYPSSDKLIIGDYKNGGIIYGDFYVVLAKNSKTGIISFHLAEGTMSDLVGNAVLYLDDNTTISLKNTGIHDNVNGKNIYVFYLTSLEIEKLKKTNVNSIRFNTISGGHLLKNAEHSEYNGMSKQPTNTPKVDFPTIISELFK
jgi:hypothetical protein